MLNTQMKTDVAFNHLFTESGSLLLIYQSRFSLRQNVNMCPFFGSPEFSESPGRRAASQDASPEPIAWGVQNSMSESALSFSIIYREKKSKN